MILSLVHGRGPILEKFKLMNLVIGMFLSQSSVLLYGYKKNSMMVENNRSVVGNGIKIPQLQLTYNNQKL